MFGKQVTPRLPPAPPLRRGFQVETTSCSSARGVGCELSLLSAIREPTELPSSLQPAGIQVLLVGSWRAFGVSKAAPDQRGGWSSQVQGVLLLPSSRRH